MLNDNFKKDFNKAKEYSIGLEQKLKEAVRADEIISLEDLDNKILSNIFDIHSGIDLIIINKNGIRGMAMRVQYCKEKHAFNSFTIRVSRKNDSQTELKKRDHSIQNDYIYPYYTCQCYFEEGSHKLLSGAICKTKDLYEYVSDNKEELELGKKKCPEGNYFYAVFFTKFKTQYKIINLKTGNFQR